MGNSGARKLFFKGENVETHYKSFYSIPIVTLDKEEITLADLQGKVSLVVNTATNTEEDRKSLSEFKRIHDSGLQVPILLFPSNSFKNESNTYADIK
jgi:glutathione peroxidase-family protein